MVDSIAVVLCAYRTIPALTLTELEMQRRRGFDADICDTIVTVLERANLLCRTSVGAYVKAAA